MQAEEIKISLARKRTNTHTHTYTHAGRQWQKMTGERRKILGKMEMESMNRYLPRHSLPSRLESQRTAEWRFLWQILIKCIIRIYYSNAVDLCKERRRCFHKY